MRTKTNGERRHTVYVVIAGSTPVVRARFVYASGLFLLSPRYIDRPYCRSHLEVQDAAVPGRSRRFEACLWLQGDDVARARPNGEAAIDEGRLRSQRMPSPRVLIPYVIALRGLTGILVKHTRLAWVAQLAE
jgi:hypothetical protein